MLVKSILKMKNLTLALAIILLLSGLSITSVILQGNDYPVRMIESVTNQYKPNMEVLLEGITAPWGVYVPQCQKARTLPELVEAAKAFGETELGPLKELAQQSPLIGCSSGLVYIAGGYMSGPLNLFIPLGKGDKYLARNTPSQDKVNITEMITRDALRKVGLSDEWIHRYLSLYSFLGTKVGPGATIPVEYYQPVPPVEPEEPPGAVENETGTANETGSTTQYTFIINSFSYTLSNSYARSIMDNEPLHAELVYLKTPAGGALIAYYQADIYIIVADNQAANCLGLGDQYREINAETGDGVVTGIVSPILGPLLGIEEESWGEVKLGGVTLRLYNPGTGVPPYSYMLVGSPVHLVYPGHEVTYYYYREALYRYLYSIIVPPSELEDLDRALVQDSITQSGLLPAALTYIHYSPVFLISEGAAKAIELTSLEALAAFNNSTGSILVPSPIFLESMGRLEPQDLLGKAINVSNTSEVSPYSGAVFGVSVAAYSLVADYDPQFLAKAGRKDLAAEINRLNDYINSILEKGSLDGKDPLANCSEDIVGGSTRILDIIILKILNSISTSMGTLGVYLGQGQFVEVTTGITKSAGYVVRVDIQRLSNLVNYRQMGMFTDPLVGLGVVSLVPAILLTAWIMTSDSVEIMIANARRWIAVAHARGASLKSTRKRLAGTLALLAVALAGLGGVGGAVLTALGTGARLGSYVGERINLIVVSILLAVIVVAIVSWRRTKSLLQISPVEAVRPVMSIARASLPRPGRFNTLALVLLGLSLVIGLPRINIDNIDFERFGSFGILLAIIIFISMMLSPLAPLLALSEASRFATLAIARRRLSSAIVRLVARGRGGLDWLAESSGEKIRDLLLSGTRAGALGMGMTLGSALGAAGLGIGYYRVIAGTEIGTPEKLGALQTVASMLDALAVIGGAFTVLLVTVMTLSVFRELERNVVILRARGASSRQALMFVYASLAPFIVSVILAGIVTAAVFYLALDSVTGIAFMADFATNKKPPHIPVTLGFFEALVVVIVLAALWLVPLAVSYKAARTRDIARLLREGM